MNQKSIKYIPAKTVNVYSYSRGSRRQDVNADCEEYRDLHMELKLMGVKYKSLKYQRSEEKAAFPR